MMKTILDVDAAAKLARKRISELSDRVDIYETVANRARRLETIDSVEVDLQILCAEIARHCDIVDVRRVSIQQLDEVK